LLKVETFHSLERLQ